MLNYKKYLAAALAATMVVGSSTVAFAATSPSNFEMSGSDVKTEDRDADKATGTINATGKVEGYVEQEVFKVEVPTIPEKSTLFNFILDPQGLIEATQGAAYNTAAGSNVTFTTNTTMYFKNDINKAAGNEDYSNKSDYVELKNKGTIDVDASVTATVAALDKIEMATSETFDADDDSTSIYLALVDDGTGKEVLTADAAGVTLDGGTIAKSTTTDYYKVDYVDGKYTYELDPTVNATFNSFKFALTGASNPNGDWSQLTKAAPTVKVVWSVVAHVNPVAPTAPANVTVAVPAEVPDNGITIPMSMGAGSAAATTITVTYTNSSGQAATLAEERYEVLPTGLRIRASYLRDSYANFAGAGREFTVTLGFEDTTKTPVTGKFTLTQETAATP